MELDITPLGRSVARLDEGLQRYLLDTSDQQIRDGLIQRFEFTYELSHRMLKRYLEAASASPAEFGAMDFQTLIRTGNEHGLLLGDWPAWRTWRHLRARSSHSYNEDVALEVVAAIPGFLAEAQYLLQQLTERIG